MHDDLLFHIVVDKRNYIIKRYNVGLVIQVRMHRIRNNEKTFVVACQTFECRLCKISRMCFFTVHDKHRTANFICILQQRSVEKRY